METKLKIKLRLHKFMNIHYKIMTKPLTHMNEQKATDCGVD